jgi:hypothetical protein
LYSPPRTPSYNGGTEVGIGAMTARTEQRAAWQYRPGKWLLDDLAAAQQQANATAQPRGQAGLTAQQLWTQRTTITREQRNAFRATAAQTRQELQAPEGSPANSTQRQTLDRQAVRRALESRGYLNSKFSSRRRIPLPVPQPM